MNLGVKGEGKGRIYLKSSEIDSLLGYMAGRERGYKIVDGNVHGGVRGRE